MMETKRLPVKDQPNPVLLPSLKQEEPLIRDLVKLPLKQELPSDIVSTCWVKSELENVKEEPDMSLFNVKEEFPMDNDPYGLRDRNDDPLAIQFREGKMEPVMCNIAQLPMSPLMVEKRSKCRNVCSSVASENVHNNQNISVATSDRSTIREHEEVHVRQIKHEKSLPPNECTVGNNSDDYEKRFKDSISTERSLRECNNTVFTNEMIYECDTIHNCFSRKNILVDHFKIHTGEKNYKCNECGKCFTESGHLKVHLRIHSGEKKCNECGKCFTQTGNLNIHLRIHSGEKNYKCIECGKCFTRSGDLKRHLRIHSDEKNYKCNECGKCFTRNGDLKRHLRIHSAEKNYKCNECGKCFTQTGNLNVHLRIHSGEKNYKCN